MQTLNIQRIKTSFNSKGSKSSTKYRHNPYDLYY